MEEYIMQRFNPSKGLKTYGRFKVHPDKVLLRIYPIKSVDRQTGLFVPAHAQKRDMTFRYAKVLQIGKNVEEWADGGLKPGDFVICNKYVDNVYGLEGKFKIAGKLVCVTMPSEILIGVEFTKEDMKNLFGGGDDKRESV
jgi:co-chaperonin GroES (HSP10)